MKDYNQFIQEARESTVPAHIQAMQLPAGPIKISWQTGVKSGQKEVNAWVVQLPKAPGFSYFSAPSGHDSKSGSNSLRKAVLHGIEMAKYKKRALWIGATEQQVKQALGKEVKMLKDLVGLRYTKAPKAQVTESPDISFRPWATDKNWNKKKGTCLACNGNHPVGGECDKNYAIARGGKSYWTGTNPRTKVPQYSTDQSKMKKLTRAEADAEAKKQGAVVVQLSEAAEPGVLQVEVFEARGLRIMINGELPAEKDWGYGEGKNEKWLAMEKPLHFGELALKAVGFDSKLSDYPESEPTKMFLKFTNRTVTADVTDIATNEMVTLVNGKRQRVDEITLYVRAEAKDAVTEARIPPVTDRNEDGS